MLGLSGSVQKLIRTTIRRVLDCVRRLQPICVGKFSAFVRFHCRVRVGRFLSEIHRFCLPCPKLKGDFLVDADANVCIWNRGCFLLRVFSLGDQRFNASDWIAQPSERSVGLPNRTRGAFIAHLPLRVLIGACLCAILQCASETLGQRRSTVFV